MSKVTVKFALAPITSIQVTCAEQPKDTLFVEVSNNQLWFNTQHNGRECAVFMTRADAITFAEALIDMARQ